MTTLLFTIIEIKNDNQKWETLGDNAFWTSNICEQHYSSKDYENFKIRPFECSETMMMNLFNEENFPLKIHQYQTNDIKAENDYYHFFNFYEDINRLKYILLEDILNFNYKNILNPNVYKLQQKWQYKCQRCLFCKDLYKTNSGNESLNYENYLGKRFFEDLENLKKLGNAENIRVCFWIDEV
ncbi:MAG: hypothetical protein H7239_13500 [Flavobacterium sp.]|nr:hypothetical protein [Flavobacterium sp.]